MDHSSVLSAFGKGLAAASAKCLIEDEGGIFQMGEMEKILAQLN